MSYSEYIYFFARLFKSETDDDSKQFKPFMTNSWFVYHTTDDSNIVSMIRDTPFTIPIEYGQKLRFQLVRWKKNHEFTLEKQTLDYYPKIKEIMETKDISPLFVHSRGFEILADFIYTADETNPIQNYQGFEIQFKYCIMPDYKIKKDTDDESTLEQVYMTHPTFKWPK